MCWLQQIEQTYSDSIIYYLAFKFIFSLEQKPCPCPFPTFVFATCFENNVPMISSVDNWVINHGSTDEPFKRNLPNVFVKWFKFQHLITELDTTSRSSRLKHSQELHFKFFVIAWALNTEPCSWHLKYTIWTWPLSLSNTNVANNLIFL